VLAKNQPETISSFFKFSASRKACLTVSDAIAETRCEAVSSSVSIGFVLNAIPEDLSRTGTPAPDLEQLRPVLRRSAGAILRREDDIEDAVQEALLRILRQGARLDPQPKMLRAFACTTVRRVALDMLARKQPLAAGDTLEFAAGEIQNAPALDREHINGRLTQAVNKLPDPQRMAFLLVHQEGLTHPEAAQELRISHETLRARLYRARLQLRTELKDLRP
jgi:RNA polymerase sigma-70 factor (ECF subfamily)